MRVSKACSEGVEGCSEGVWASKACRVCVSKVCRVHVGIVGL